MPKRRGYVIPLPTSFFLHRPTSMSTKIREMTASVVCTSQRPWQGEVAQGTLCHVSKIYSCPSRPIWSQQIGARRRTRPTRISSFSNLLWLDTRFSALLYLPLHHRYSRLWFNFHANVQKLGAPALYYPGFSAPVVARFVYYGEKHGELRIFYGSRLVFGPDVTSSRCIVGVALNGGAEENSLIYDGPMEPTRWDTRLLCI